MLNCKVSRLFQYFPTWFRWSWWRKSLTDTDFNYWNGEYMVQAPKCSFQWWPMVSVLNYIFEQN